MDLRAKRPAPALERPTATRYPPRLPPVPQAAFDAALAAYHRGEYFEAHELWEDLWRAEGDPVQKDFLQGLIQVAAAMHKLLRMNGAAGAIRILDRARGRLAGVPDGTMGLDLGRLRADVEAARAAIESLQRQDRTDLDPALVPHIEPL